MFPTDLIGRVGIEDPRHCSSPGVGKRMIVGSPMILPSGVMFIRIAAPPMILTSSGHGFPSSVARPFARFLRRMHNYHTSGSSSSFGFLLGAHVRERAGGGAVDGEYP